MKIVNVLIYGEPIVFLEQIEKNKWMLSGLFNMFVYPLTAIKDRDRKYKFSVICNEFHVNEFSWVYDRDNEFDVELIEVTQRELTNNWKYEPFWLNNIWLNEPYNEEVLDYYCSLFKTKILIEPDIIISIFCAPFLKNLFSNALYFRWLKGIFSRSPYPCTESYIFGDVSLPYSYVNEYWNRIKLQHQLTDVSKELIMKFKVKCKKLLMIKNPFTYILKEYKLNYDYLFLLPLSIPYNLYFAKQKYYHSEFHFLIDVLDKMPNNIGIIVTTHPINNFLDDDMITCLKNRYNNFLFNSSFNSYLSTSQFLLPEVDGVICIITSVAMQAMIFNKKIISLGNQLAGICDYSSIEDLVSNLDAPAQNKDDLLFWFLTRYCFTSKYFQDSEWVDKFMMRSLEKFRNKDLENFYELIDDPENIFNHLLDCLDESVSQIPQHSHELQNVDKQLTFSVRQTPIEYNNEFLFKTGSVAALYLVSGFSLPEQSCTWVTDTEAVIEFPISFRETDLIITIKGQTFTQKQTTEIAINNRVYGKIEYFDSKFDVKAADLSGHKSIQIKLMTSKLHSPKELGINDDTRMLAFALYSVGIYEIDYITTRDLMVHEIAELTSKISETEALVYGTQIQNTDLHLQVARLQEQCDALQKSTSWKITKPLRVLKRLI